MNDENSIAGNVRAAMAVRQVSGTEMANRLGMTQAAFSRRYRGTTQWKASEIPQIAEAMGVTLRALVDGDGVHEPGAAVDDDSDRVADVERRLADLRSKAFRMIRQIDRLREDLAELAEELDPER